MSKYFISVTGSAGRVFAVWLMVVSFVLTAVAHTPEDSVASLEPLQKPISIPKMPADTLDRFILKYGKDSLVNLINTSIANTIKSLESAKSARLMKLTSLELQLVNKQYKLGIDPYLSIFDDISGMVYRLYGARFGVSSKMKAMIDTMRINNVNIYDDFTREIKNPDTRYGFAVFGSDLLVTDSLIDTLYSFSKQLDKPLEKLGAYWIFSEFCRNVKEPRPLASKYKADLFVPLYKAYNIPLAFAGVMDSVSKQYEFKCVESLNMMAYGFYGGELNLKDNGADVMYLLSTMYKSGGWRRYYLPASTPDVNASTYGLWALVEIREKLKTYSPGGSGTGQ